MYEHIRGSTFAFTGQLQNDGVAVDVTNATIVVKVSNKAGTIPYATLVVTPVIPAQGIVNISCPDTSQWPIGLARIDSMITFQQGGNVVISQPDYFRVLQSPMVG